MDYSAKMKTAVFSALLALGVALFLTLSPGLAYADENTGQAQTPENTGQAQTPENTGQAQTPENTGQAQTPENTGQAQTPAAATNATEENEPQEPATDIAQESTTDNTAAAVPTAATITPTENATPEWAVDDGQGSPSDANAAEEPLPSAFDQRDQDLVTPVKYQNPWMSCWAFGGTGAAETSMLTALETNYSEFPIDLSERHLTYFALRPISELIDSEQAGEGVYTFDESPNAPFDAGGNPIFITTLFGLGIGPVMEEMFPYRGVNGITELDYYDSLSGDELEVFVKHELEATATQYGMDVDTFLAFAAQRRGETVEETFEYFRVFLRNTYVQSNCYSKSDDWSIPEQNSEGGFNRLISHGVTLEDGNILPGYWNADKTQINPDSMYAIKKALASGLGVCIMFGADQSGAYTMSDVDEQGQSKNNMYNQYRDDPNASANHGVQVIGWDDNYLASNFNPAHQPPANGAWIIKNSWGSTKDAAADDLGNVIGKREYGFKDADGEYTGCIYLSYYDKSLMAPEMMEFSTMLDGAGGFYPMVHDYMPPAGGLYRESSEQIMSSANVFVGDDDRIIRDVAISTADPNTRTTIAIYILDENAETPTDGTLVYRATHDFEYEGYHRIRLEEPIPVRANTFFSVVTTSHAVDETGKTTYGIAANQAISKADAEDMRSKGARVPIYSQAVVNAGESFLYKNGEWKDWADYINEGNGSAIGLIDNFSIKVFAESAPYALEHHAATAATCTEAGNTEYWHDTTLNKFYKDEAGTEEIALFDTIVPALDHAWDEGKVTREPTATEPGVRTFTCQICNTTRIESIPATGSAESKAEGAKASTPMSNIVFGTAKSMPNTGDGNTMPMTLLIVAVSSAVLALYARRSFSR